MSGHLFSLLFFTFSDSQTNKSLAFFCYKNTIKILVLLILQQWIVDQCEEVHKKKFC